LKVYLDHNATTPLDPRVLEEMLPFLTSKFGNAASRTHLFGWEAEEAVKIARERIANLVGAEPGEIVFTSGATESDNLALKGVAEIYASRGDHLITVATEHKAVLDTCEYLEKTGRTVTYLPVDADGRITPEQVAAAMTDRTILVSVMLANNETGVLQPIREIAEVVHAKGAILMSDATQAVGKMPVKVNEWGIDLMAFSAHKMHGPKGVGALYVRRRGPRVALAPQMHGGGHEKGFRSGTLNVPGIVGFGMAALLASEEAEEEAVFLRRLRDRLEKALLALPDVRVNGSLAHRMEHVTNLSFGGVEAEALMMAMRDLAVSTGSACTSASLQPSHVLQAMGLSQDDAYASIRFSLGRFTTGEEIDYAIQTAIQAIQQLRLANPLWQG
jgi:cysteine desulfurase